MMEFITVVHPGQSASASSKRQAHSHAARVAHARARKLRVANYMQKKNAIEDNSNREATNLQSLKGDQTAVVRQQHKQDLTGRNEISPSPPVTISTAFEPELLANFVKSLTARERFMFSHYVDVVVPYLDHHCPAVQYLGKNHDYIRKNWILLSATDVDLLRGFLLASCRHLSMVRLNKDYLQLAIQYKLNYVQNLRETISAGSPSSNRMAVTRALVLALDEIMLGDLSMASKHVSGALHIVQMAGGSRALGLNGFVNHILESCVYGKRILDWIPVLNCSDMFMKPDPIHV